MTYLPMNKRPLAERIDEWLTYSYALNRTLTRVLLHPDDRAEAKKLYPSGRVIHPITSAPSLPIEYLSPTKAQEAR